MVRQLGLCRSFSYYSQSFCSTVFAMLLDQQLWHAFSCEKAYNKYSIKRITYGKNSNFSCLEVSTIKLTVFTRFVARALIFFNLTHCRAPIQTGVYLSTGACYFQSKITTKIIVEDKYFTTFNLSPYIFHSIFWMNEQ